MLDMLAAIAAAILDYGDRIAKPTSRNGFTALINTYRVVLDDSLVSLVHLNKKLTIYHQSQDRPAALLDSVKCSKLFAIPYVVVELFRTYGTSTLSWSMILPIQYPCRHGVAPNRTILN